jgi:hypothetical protein
MVPPPTPTIKYKYVCQYLSGAKKKPCKASTLEQKSHISLSCNIHKDLLDYLQLFNKYNP